MNANYTKKTNMLISVNLETISHVNMKIEEISIIYTLSNQSGLLIIIAEVH